MKRVFLPGLLLALTLAGCGKKIRMECVTAKVGHADIQNSVTATGTIEPVTSVDVGTQVSGIVSHIFVDYNSPVKKGQVIAQLDMVNLQSELSGAQANLRSARANLKSLQSALDYQTANYERYTRLYEKGLISANDYEQARLSHEQAVRSHEQAAQAVSQQVENVKRAQTNLDYATITSPIDGVVLSKEVEEGQTVASSFNTPTLFKIAQDLTDMRVIADVDEADIGQVKEGLPVTFTVDAYPDDLFRGRVTQVRQQATTESNVVTYEVVISAPNADLKLKPGLTASVNILTLDVPDALAVPSRALKFTPSPDMLAEGESIEDKPEAPHKVWVKEGTVYRAVPVTVGESSATHTQILSGVAEGREVVVDIRAKSDAPEEELENPFMPKRPASKKDGKKK